jgi:hypothetical protein
VFDANQPITITLRGPAGLKSIRVRFPTDEEWIERQRRRKIIIKQLGRGMSETIVPDSSEADADLLARIRLDDGGAEVDQFESSRLIEQLSQVEVDDVVQEGGSFRISLRIPGGTASVILRMPTAKDVFTYRRNFARVVDLPYGRQELTINLAPAGDLFRTLCEQVDGYNGAVPIIHQAVAVKAAIDALDGMFGEASVPN